MLIARLVVLELWNCKLAYFFYFFLSFFPFWQSTFGGPAFSDLQVCTFVHMMCPWSRCCRLCCATNNAMTPDSVTLLLLYVDVAVCRPVFCVSASAAVLSVLCVRIISIWCDQYGSFSSWTAHGYSSRICCLFFTLVAAVVNGKIPALSLSPTPLWLK